MLNGSVHISLVNLIFNKSGYFFVATDCEKILGLFEKMAGINLVSRSRLPPH